MRKLSIIWFCHFAATVAGWYLLSALAQGAVDSRVGVTFPIVVFNAIIEILCFPLLFLATRVFPSQLGGFSLSELLVFAALAALNSAVVVACISAGLRSLQRAKAESS